MERTSLRLRIVFHTRIGRLIVLEAILFLVLGLIALLYKSYFYHGFLIGLLAVPQFVTGVYYYFMSTYNKRVPPRTSSILPLILPILSTITLYYNVKASLLLLAINYSIVVAMTYYASKPLTDSLYSQKIIALSSYLSTVLVLMFSTLTPGVSIFKTAIAVLYALPVGMIYAINSSALTYTYKVKPRSRLAVLIAILQVASPLSILSGYIQAFMLGSITSFTLYILMVKIENVEKILRLVNAYREPSKVIHLNLLISSVFSLLVYPVPLYTLYYDLVGSIHVLLFGFIMLNISAHAPVLLPTVLKLKAKRRPKLLCIPLSLLAVLLKIFDYNLLAGVLIVTVLIVVFMGSVKTFRL